MKTNDIQGNVNVQQSKMKQYSIRKLLGQILLTDHTWVEVWIIAEIFPPSLKKALQTILKYWDLNTKEKTPLVSLNSQIKANEMNITKPPFFPLHAFLQ